MSATTDLLIKDLAKTIFETPGKKPSAYDTQAEVRRVEGDIAWVHIPGGVDETPVQLTTNAKKGDIVQVRVSGGRAWLYGNATAPPTDDTVAKAAQKKADVADEHATNSLTSAMLAQQFAEEAKESADEAKVITDQIADYAQTAELTVAEILDDAVTASDAAERAEIKADAAELSASNAYQSASLALSQLGIVEDIVGVLDLVSKNGLYELTDDIAIEEDKWYFEVEGTAVVDPSGNPNQQNLYELVNNIYSLTNDTSVVTGKTYYTLTSSVVLNPTLDDIEDYYELIDIADAIQDYVSSHITLVDGTLYLQNGETRLSLSTNANEGLTFYNNGQPVARYGTTAIIGDQTGFHIEISSTELSFFQGSRKVAYVSNNQLYITQSVVLEQMQLGQTVAEGGIGQWVWKVHPNADGLNNLNLKWNG